MPDLTPRLGIKKPLENENVMREAFNENYDIIDANAAKKTEVDAVQTILNNHTSLGSAHGSTSAATPNTIMQRGADGQAHVGAPTAATHIARKQDVDAVAAAAGSAAATAQRTADSAITQVNVLDTIVSASPSPTPLNLNYGTQVVNVSRASPYNVMGLDGHTLVNLLGRDGNCEDIKKWTISSFGLIMEETSIVKYGNKSLRLALKNTINGQQASEMYQYYSQATAGKKYIAIADIYNHNASAIYIMFASQYGNLITSGNGFKTSYLRFAETSNNLNRKISVEISGAADQYGYVDGIRLYEISQADYDAIPNMSPEQIAAKWPYVDDMKPITNPYVIKYGENLLPPFAEWTASNNAPTSIVSPYSFFCTSSGAYQGLNVSVTPVAGATYTFSGIGSGNYVVDVASYNKNMVSTYLNYLTGEGFGSITFTVPDDSFLLNIQISNAAFGATRYSFKNPMLNLGNTANPFKPRKDNYLFFPGQWCSNIDGSIADQMYRGGEDYYKLAKFKAMDLDGSLVWENADTGSGVKLIKVRISNYIAFDSTAKVIRYDGKILSNATSVPWQNNGKPSDSFNVWNDGFLYVSVPNSLSGWGDGYTPSQTEIQAYFDGWVMVKQETWNTIPEPYNNTGTRGWVKRWVGVGVKSPLTSTVGELQEGTGVTTVPTTVINSAYKPYRLQYQLAQQVHEKIVPEGDITLHGGPNQIEVGAGMIIREKANIPDSNSWAYINDSIAPSSALKNRSAKILSVFKNETKDPAWSIDNIGNASPYYGQRAYKPISSFDPSATYTVTYLALDQYSLTCDIQSIQGQYDANLKTSFDSLSRNQADIITRVSVLEKTKAQKVQPQWITPTLLSGWSTWVNGDAPKYYKDDFGIVHVTGAIQGGTTANDTPIFVLPKGYRPARGKFEPCVSNAKFAYLQIGPSGYVVIYNADAANFIFDFSFLAEQ